MELNRNLDLGGLDELAKIGGSDDEVGVTPNSTPITIPFTIITVSWVTLLISVSVEPETCC